MVLSLLAAIFVFCNLTGKAQSTIDSLKIEVNSSENDSSKVDLLLDIAWHFYDNPADSCIYYTEKAFELAKQNYYTKGIANSYYLLGNCFLDSQEMEKSLVNFLQAAKAYEQINDAIGAAKVYSQLGVLYYYENSLLTSYEYYNKALEIGQQENHQLLIATASSNIGLVFLKLKNFPKSLEYYEKSLEMNTALNDTNNMVLDLIDISDVYLETKKYDKALNVLKKAFTYSDKITDEITKVDALMSMGETYMAIEEYDSAYKYLYESHQKTLQQESDWNKIYSYLTFGKYYNKTGDYEQAIQYFQNSLTISDSIESTNFHHELFDALSTAYLGLQNYQQAYYWLNRAREFSDSLKTEEISKTLAQTEKQKELDQIQNQFYQDQLQKEQSLANRAYRSRLIAYFAILAAVLLLLVTGLIARNYLIKSRINKSLENQNKIIREQKLLLQQNIEALKKRKLELNQLNATKDKFFSIIAHDLRNPFNSLVGFTSMLIEQPELRNSDRLEEILQIIYKTATLSHDLLENLLEWARSQTGKLKVSPSNFNISNLFKDNIDLFGEMASKKNIELTSSIPENIFVFGDSNMFNTIIRNFISNAIKFTPKSGKINLYSRIENKHAFFSVQDTGIGIKKENIEKLFLIDEGFQTEGTENELGTGLGLILCHEFIKKNKGEISVESQPGVGSTFSFSVPLS